MFILCICFRDPSKPFARNMFPRAQPSGQGACCLDIGFRHMSSVPDCASFRATHVPCGRRGGNYVMMCIYFVRFVYSTVNCLLAVCVRNDLGRPTFQSDSFLTHAVSATVSSIMFLIRFMFLS